MQVISTHTQLSHLRSRITPYKFFVYRLKYITDTQFLNDCIESDVEVAWGRAQFTWGACGSDRRILWHPLYCSSVPP